MVSKTTEAKGIRLPNGEWRRLEREAAELGITVTELIRSRLADTSKGASADTPTPTTH